MKFKPQQIRDIVDRDLLALLSLEDDRARPHWDFSHNNALLDESILDQMVDPPRSMRFRRADSVGFLWLWAVIDSHPDDPTNGCLIVMKPYKNPQLCQYGVATKPSGKVYGTVDDLYVSLRDAIEMAGFVYNVRLGGSQQDAA
jgi:hypothetical protein